MKISLINATYSNFEYIIPLLKNLNSQNYKNFELIVCDQNSNNIIKDQINYFNSEFDIRYIKIDVPGLSNARNHGLDIAKGDIIGFVDDDCSYPPNFFKKISDYFFENKGLHILSVSIRDEDDLSLLPFTPINEKVPIKFENIFDTITSVGFFHLKNNQVRFDKKFGLGAEYGSCEEMDYVYQLLLNGFSGFYLPELYVMHPKVFNLKDQNINNIFKRSKGHGAYFKKNNLPMFKSFQIILLRPLGGLILSLFKFDLKLFNRYKYMLFGRIVGYYSYKND